MLTLHNECKKRLLRNAVDCTAYVAYGKSMAEDIMVMHDASMAEVKGALASAAVEVMDILMEQLKELK